MIEADSLIRRRRQIRRQRRHATHLILSSTGWGFGILLVGWLLMSGLSGLSTGS